MKKEEEKRLKVSYLFKLILVVNIWYNLWWKAKAKEDREKAARENAIAIERDQFRLAIAAARREAEYNGQTFNEVDLLNVLLYPLHNHVSLY